jgi:transcriptional regulator with XRE-family HTH domain
MIHSSDSDFLILLGNRIKTLRKEKAVSQRELAYKIGMEKSNLSVIENGKSNPQILTLLKIAAALEVKPNVLFDFDFNINHFLEHPETYTPRKHF